MKNCIAFVLILIANVQTIFGHTENETSPLLASTFIGSSSYDDDYGPSMLIDNDGNIYLCGYTSSSTFPAENGYDVSYNGGKDIFVAKFNSDLSVLLVSTFIGGSYDDRALDILLDSENNIYISGYSKSSDFPATSSAYDALNPRTTGDCFISKFNANLGVNTTGLNPNIESQNIKIFNLNNYPNPFNSLTSICFELQSASNDKVLAYNSMGIIFATLIDKTLPSGFHTVTFDSILLASGVYILHCSIGNQTVSKKIIKSI